MSYYTTFEITIERIDPKTFAPTWDKNVLKTPSNSEVPGQLVDKIQNLCEDLEFDQIATLYGYAKWYDWREELVELSKQYPEFMFTVDGAGEDFPDAWICWIVNGRSQYTTKKMVHDPFDPEKFM